ncbi:i-AAA protease yme1 [Saxophila tyrrhenica]|uniref:2-dehydropantoate 2-reductase n=1 Tax=Saxophila tyrrhenica TaxID=1690608 RepID=A0AAV9PPN9_9PEZI|nr:i-AAA protease yme1 [Saxophila tyrrhenica]
MSEDKKTKVLLFGLGAIGGFYAFICGRNDDVVLSVAARSNYEAVKANGLKIESEGHGSHKVRIDHVLHTPSEAGHRFDYIVCAHKAVNPSATPPLFKDVADEKTTFVLIQNGVGNEEPFREVFPKSTIITCVTWTGAVQKTSGVISHGENEGLEIGLYQNPDVDQTTEKARLDRFAEMMKKGRTTYSIEENIQVKRWEKCVWNAAWNPITTLTQVDTQTWLHSSPEAMATTRQLWHEMIDVAKRCDVPLEHELVDRLMEKILSMKGVFSSMYVDSQAGRPMEVDVILGTAVRKAKELKMEVPVLNAIYAMTAAVDQRITTNLK